MTALRHARRALTSLDVAKSTSAPDNAESAVGWMVPLRAHGTRPALFCACAGGGDAFDYRDLALALSEDQPVFAFGLPSFAASQGFPTVQQLAAIYVNEVQRRQPQGPYYLCGHSFGGLVVYEMAMLFAAKGETIGFVGLIDTLRPGFKSAMPPQRLRQFQATYLVDRITRYRRNLTHGRIDLIACDAFEFVRHRIKRTWWRIARSVFGALKRPVPSALRNDDLILFSAWHRYSPSVYAGRLVLLNAAERAPEYSGDDTLGWRTCVGGPIDILVVPGDHYRIMHPPHVLTLAERIKPYLAGC
jgi:thioesterase domain-containing protein